MDGFRVDVSTLAGVAEALRDVVASVPPSPAEGTGAEAFGHAGLADGVAAFRDRWEGGVTALGEDTHEIAARLGRCVEDYQRADRPLDPSPGDADGRAVG